MASCSASVSCWHSSSPGSYATTRTVSCSATRCAPGTKGSTSASSYGTTARSRRASTWMSSSIRPLTPGTQTSSSIVCTRWFAPEARSPSVSEATVHLGGGKVRELYALDDDRLLLVASDRISTFHVVLPPPIPDKGRVLTGLPAFWFARTRGIVPNHLLALRDDGRSLECGRLEMLPVEIVVRGYLAGSGWKDYTATGAVCGHALPVGLTESAELPEPIFTPATKAASGHDENIDREQAAELVGADRLAEVERVSIALYRHAAERARRRGILIADTKFEFGLDERRLVLGHQALTPDSSRFWPAEDYAAARSQPPFDKQFVRDYCETLGWDKTPPGPELPDDVVAGTRARYVEAFERLTGIAFDDYLADPEVVLR